MRRYREARREKEQANNGREGRPGLVGPGRAMGDTELSLGFLARAASERARDEKPQGFAAMTDWVLGGKG